MPSPIADLLADLAAALDRAGVSWYLFGAQAAILYGAARLTADVDVTIQLPEALSLAELVGSFEEGGFRQRIPDPTFIDRTRVIPFVHIKSGLPLDMVLAGPGLEERFFARVKVRDIDRIPVRVASAEDIVVMKVLAGRPKDLDDVVAIVAAQEGRLDFSYIRETLAALEQALSQRDLRPAFEDAVIQARRRD